MRLNVALALSALVPVLGLFSCSKDKPDDSWHLTEPQIVSDQKLVALGLSDSPLQNLAGDSVLKFDANEMAGSKLELKAQCQSKLGATTSEASFVGRSEFSIRSLWPKDLWTALTDDELQQSSCNLKFIVTHDNVMHDFSLKNVRLLNFALQSSEELLAEAYANQNAGDASVIHLLCETYQSVEPAKSLLSLNAANPSILSLLASKPWKSNVPDPRLNKTTQQCRILIEGKSSDQPFVISKTFTFKFPPPKLALSMTTDFSNASRDTWRNLNVFNLKVRNTSSTIAAFSMPTNFGNIRLRLVGRQNYFSPDLGVPLGTFTLGSRVLSEPVTVQTSKAPYFRNDQFMIFELYPDEELTLEGRLNSGANCYSDVSLDPSSFPQSRNMGLMYGYEQDIQVAQFRGWTAENKDVTGEKESVGGTDYFPRTGEVPTIFAPSASFLATVGPTDRLPSYLAQYPSELLFKKPIERAGSAEVHNFCFFNKLQSEMIVLQFGAKFQIDIP